MPRFLRWLSRLMEAAPVISGSAELCALLFPCVAAFHCFSQQRGWSGIYAHRYCATQDNIAAPLCEKNWLSWQDPNIINGTIAGCLVCATLSKVPDANESIDMVFHIFLDILFPAIRVGLYVLILGRFALDYKRNQQFCSIMMTTGDQQQGCHQQKELSRPGLVPQDEHQHQDQNQN